MTNFQIRRNGLMCSSQNEKLNKETLFSKQKPKNYLQTFYEKIRNHNDEVIIISNPVSNSDNEEIRNLFFIEGQGFFDTEGLPIDMSVKNESDEESETEELR